MKLKFAMTFDFRPVSPEIYTITHSTAESMEGEMWLGKGNEGPPLHYHAHLQEDLELIDGKLKIFRNCKWEVIKEGTKWSIPPKEIHTFKTVPDADATVKFSVTPAMGFEGFLRDTQALIKSGKLTSYKSLNGLIYSSMLVRKYSDTLTPAQGSLKMIMSIANFMGKLTGKKV